MPQPIAPVAAPTRPLSRSFRRLALLFLLLVSGFVAYAWYEEKDEELGRLLLLSDFAARSADAYFEFYRSSSRWLGDELLRIDALQDPRAAHDLLVRFKRAHPELVAVNLVRPDGQWVASSALPPGSKLPDYKRLPHIWPQFRLTLEREGLHVMRTHRALLTGAWVIPLQYPVRDAGGELVFVLSAGLPLANQQALWGNVRLPDGASIGLVREDGYFQSLRPAGAAEAAYERPADCPVTRVLATDPQAQSGHFAGASDVCGPGTRYGSYYRLSHQPMAAFVGMPRSYLWAQWWARVRVPLVLFLFSAAAGLGVYRRGRAHQLAFERERIRSQAALMRLSRRNESILEAAGEGIYGLDMEGRVMFANHAAASTLGYEVDELVGQRIHPLVHHTRSDGSPYPAEACPHYASLRRGVRSHVSDEVFWTKSGTPVPIEYTSTPIRENGRVTGAVIVFRDITRRKRHEALLAGEKEVLQMIATSAPLSEVLARLARLFESQTERKAYCCVLLVDPRRDRLFVGAAPSLPEALVQQLDGLPLRADAPACASAAAGGGRVTIAGMDTDNWAPAIDKIAQEHGLRSCWSVPIRSGGEGQVLGTFNVYCADTRPPTPQELAYVERAAQTAGIAIQKKHAEDRLGYLAHRDALTGLPNRILLQDRLHHAIVHAGRRQLHLGVLYVDLDRFKHVNDTLGHAAGDQLLLTVARRLEESVRNVDTVARQGGDEFVVILEDMAKEEDVSDIAQKILTAMAQPLVIGQSEIFVTASIGVSLYPRDGKEPVTLLKNADVAMYRAKEKGRNNFEFFTQEMNYSSAEHFAMSNRLRHALERQEFRLYYQPRVDVRAGRITGAEALLRWEHPELGLVLPSKFIPLLEDTGLIVPVGEWVLRTACAQNRAWRRAGYSLERVAVNISGLQFRHGRLESTIARVLAETGLDPRGLEIELTESLIMQDVQATTAAIARLKKMGVSVSVDDFGTGYSSLSYLKRFPIDTIKIDRLFIKELTTSAEDAAIAKALIDMAHSLKIRTVAEGVETEGQLGYLRRRRCDEVQGNYFSAPVPAEQFAKLLASRRRRLFLP